MLVFTRRRNEAVVIGDGTIEIRVIRVGRDGVRLGITAPPDVTVHRREIYDMISAANASASKSDVSAATALAVRLRATPPMS